MKIKIYSDIHCDINKIESPEEVLGNGEADIYLDCGDTGELDATIKFYKNKYWKHKKVYFVSGNHTYYNTIMNDTDNLLRKKFHKKIKYLQREEIELTKDINLIGLTLWTDFKVFGDSSEFYCRNVASKTMNDYYFINKQKDLKIITNDVIDLFNENINYLKGTIKPNKKYIILTHHTPSLYSASIKYKNNFDTAAFCSNLENFILEHDNILYWCHGHCHNYSNYEIGNCKVICNPLGYKSYHEDINFNKDLIIEI